MDKMPDLKSKVEDPDRELYYFPNNWYQSSGYKD